IDGGALHTLDYTTAGRSDEWKNNVLANSARRTIRLDGLDALSVGTHTLEVTAIDPGFVLDRIDVKEAGAPAYYGAPP
ncbi:hypothetical protein ACTZF1_25915, partial [Escherichia coli]|uniref:hypothetical protein n=1 Tax=Escherichia coli TaxID=562 RepID=UPI0040686F34